jgi:hypothetical protein
MMEKYLMKPYRAPVSFTPRFRAPSHFSEILQPTLLEPPLEYERAVPIGISPELISVEQSALLNQGERGGFNLFATNREQNLGRESSMKTLSPEEEALLQGINTIYKPEINARKAPNIISELKKLLTDRYNRNPATIQSDDGQVIELPFEYIEYQNLAKNLSADNQERALQSYYQHPDHTAYRYLSKPNPWISKNTRFVNQNHEGAWSSFEKHQYLISLMYLAAKDQNTAAINGYTIEARIENFIKELSLIGRAHNWDNSRINPSTGLSEEYDDLEADKPSCSLGVHRRLFQSVQGHPLLTLLTKDLLAQEVREAVRDHFINCINDENYIALQELWQSLQEFRAPNSNILKHSHFSLEQLNLSEKQIQDILKIVQDKYGPQFNAQRYTELFSMLSVAAPFKNLAEKFGGQVGLTEILERKNQEMSQQLLSYPQLRQARLRYFEKHESHNNSDEAEKWVKKFGPKF